MQSHKRIKINKSEKKKKKRVKKSEQTYEVQILEGIEIPPTTELVIQSGGSTMSSLVTLFSELVAISVHLCLVPRPQSRL